MPRIRQYDNRYRNEDFARTVKARLVMMGLEQKDLAEYLGVTGPAVTYMLQNPERIQVERLRKIIAYLSLDSMAVLKFFGCKEQDVKRGTA